MLVLRPSIRSRWPPTYSTLVAYAFGNTSKARACGPLLARPWGSAGSITWPPALGVHEATALLGSPLDACPRTHNTSHSRRFVHSPHTLTLYGTWWHHQKCAWECLCNCYRNKTSVGTSAAHRELGQYFQIIKFFVLSTLCHWLRCHCTHRWDRPLGKTGNSKQMENKVDSYRIHDQTSYFHSGSHQCCPIFTSFPDSLNVLV